MFIIINLPLNNNQIICEFLEKIETSAKQYGFHTHTIEIHITIFITYIHKRKIFHNKCVDNRQLEKEK